MEKHEEAPSEPGKWQQLLVTIVVNLATIMYGTVIGWQSPYTSQLQSSSSPIGSEPMTDEGVSWLSGSMCLSGTLITVLLSIIPDKYSRKRMCYLMILPFIISWILLIFATEHTYIYIARVLCGVGGAGVIFFVPIYVSEISNDSIRGFLGSLLVFAVNTGILLAYILGGMMSIRVFAMVSLALSVLYFVTFVFMPESPVYLVRQNRIREAARSLMWLKAGDSLVTERTLSCLQAETKRADTKTAKLSDLFRDRATIKGMIIIVGLFAGQQFGGIFAMINYTETIFKVSGSSLSPNVASIIVATIQLFGSCLASSLVEHAGRRLLLLVSSAGMVFCHCTMGAFFYFQEFGYDLSVFDWVPVVTFSTFMIVYSLGLGGVPIIVTAEIFSRDVFSMAATVGLFVLWFASFVMVKIFSTLVALLGMYGCFFLLAALCTLTFLFCFTMIPETKGRLREDIVDELNGKRRTKSEKNIIGTQLAHAAEV